MKNAVNKNIDLPYVGTDEPPLAKVSTMYWRQLASQLEGDITVTFIGNSNLIEIAARKVSNNSTSLTFDPKTNAVEAVKLLLKKLSGE